MIEDKIQVLYATNVRLLVEKINKRGIRKENIISLFKDGEQYILIYSN